MRPDIVEGTTLPDYELPDHTTTRRKLSLLQGNDPMILMLGRGFYCPKDRQRCTSWTIAATVTTNENGTCAKKASELIAWPAVPRSIGLRHAPRPLRSACGSVTGSITEPTAMTTSAG